MVEAVTNYARYRREEHRNLLGRFVIGVSHLEEMAAVAPLPHEGDEPPWDLSAVLSPRWRADFAQVVAFDAAHRDPAAGRAEITALETRPAHPDEIGSMAAVFGASRAVYYELPLDGDPTPWIQAVGAARGFAKARLGGITEDAIPPADQVARFLRRCHELEVPFKATAGLHHLLRAEYALTYEPDSPRALLFGFLNVFAAAALTRCFDLPEETIVEVLTEGQLEDWSFQRGAITWRGHRLAASEVARVRRGFAHSFGSCSFEEPVDELTKAGLT
jgi:hypothetical protein